MNRLFYDKLGVPRRAGIARRVSDVSQRKRQACVSGDDGASFGRSDPTFMRVKQRPAFDADTFLHFGGAGKTIVNYQPAHVIFSQGDASDGVLYIQKGAVKLSMLSHGGKEAVVGMLGPGDFFGEHALTGHPVRKEAATAITATTALIVPTRQMIRLLHDQHALSDRFITHMLARNIRLEADLVDQLFNFSEKRLARTLLLLAGYGKPGQTHRVLSRISQETLAEMIGATRSRVNFFMNKFKKSGFIDYNGGLDVNPSLLTVIVDDEPVPRSGHPTVLNHRSHGHR